MQVFSVLNYDKTVVLLLEQRAYGVCLHLNHFSKNKTMKHQLTLFIEFWK